MGTMGKRKSYDLNAQLLARLHVGEEQAAFLANARQLLADTNALLSSDLDVEGTLAAVARLALPHQGVWSILDVHEGTVMRRVAVSHPLPSMQEVARELIAGWPPARHLPGGGARVMRTGRSEIVAKVTDAMLRQLAESSAHLRVLRRLHIGSTLTVAVTTPNGVLGALTFIAPRGGHSFDARDQELAEHIAAGAALAIVKARRVEARRAVRATQSVTRVGRLSFAAALSHTFRTPLHNIFGYAQLLEEGVRGPLTGEQRHDVHRIQANERHLLNLVDAVVSFARWDDAEELTLEDVQVRDAVRRVDTLVTLAAARKGVIYRPQHDRIDKRLIVRAETERLHEILLQLLLNAVKFSRPGDSVTIKAITVGERCWIRVTDTGVGIARDDLPLVFQPFVRSRHVYARAQEGTGLGLAIAQKLAARMGGDVLVASQLERGSTFTLKLPLGRRPPVLAAG